MYELGEKDDKEEHMYLKGVSDATDYILYEINTKHLDVDEDLKEEIEQLFRGADEMKTIIEGAASSDRIEHLQKIGGGK